MRRRDEHFREGFRRGEKPEQARPRRKWKSKPTPKRNKLIELFKEQQCQK